jgi:hypothetical protein
MHDRTASLLPQERQSWLLHDEVVGIRVVGTVVPAADYLLAGHERHWIGREPPSEADTGRFAIPSPHVSKAHCTIERRNGRWLVFDRGSRTGIYQVGASEGERRTTIELVPGLAFRVGPIPLVAYSQPGRTARVAIQHYFGLQDHFQVTVEAVLRTAGERKHVVLMAPPGGRGNKVAEALHGASTRASWPYEMVTEISPREADQRRLLDRLAYGTLVVPFDGLPRPDAPIFTWLATWTHNVRLVILAAKGTRVSDGLGEAMLTASAIIAIPTLAERRGEIGAVAASIRHEVSLRLSRRDLDLSPADLAKIEGLPWPKNLQELEEYVTRLLALRAFATEAEAARWVGITKSALSQWKKKYGFTGPPYPSL